MLSNYEGKADLKARIKEIIAEMFRLQKELRELEPDYRWGFLNIIGDYGEYMAIEQYSLQRAASGQANFDAMTKDDQTVQIKSSRSSSSIGIRGESDLLLVVGINDSADIETIYYGPTEILKQHFGFSERDNKKTIGVSKLRKLATEQKLAGNLKKIM